MEGAEKYLKKVKENSDFFRDTCPDLRENYNEFTFNKYNELKDKYKKTGSLEEYHSG